MRCLIRMRIAQIWTPCNGYDTTEQMWICNDAQNYLSTTHPLTGVIEIIFPTLVLCAPRAKPLTQPHILKTARERCLGTWHFRAVTRDYSPMHNLPIQTCSTRTQRETSLHPSRSIASKYFAMYACMIDQGSHSQRNHKYDQ